MSNPRKPTNLKILSGNPGKRPLPASEPQYEIADTNPPAWLSGEALTQWGTLASALDVNGMLNAANREFLATYCDLLGAYIDNRRAGGEPDLKIVQQLRLMAREFGFTPSSQAGISAPGKPNAKAEKSRFFG